MYSHEDRIRAVKLYIKLGKRTGATLRQRHERPPRFCVDARRVAGGACLLRAVSGGLRYKKIEVRAASLITPA
jgi:hypothetical protein